MTKIKFTALLIADTVAGRHRSANALVHPLKRRTDIESSPLNLSCRLNRRPTLTTSRLLWRFKVPFKLAMRQILWPSTG